MQKKDNNSKKKEVYKVNNKKNRSEDTRLNSSH